MIHRDEQALTRVQLWRYASVGLVTAAASLPLYLMVPHLYAQTMGAPLAAVGLVVMTVRLLDAWTDPWFGRLIDQTQGPRFEAWIRPALVILTIGFLALFMPPDGLVGSPFLLVYLAVAAGLISLANGVITVAHQAWPVRWKPAAHQGADQVRLVSAREWLTLVGVIVSAGLAAADQRLALCVLLLCAAALAFGLIRGLPGQVDGPGEANDGSQPTRLPRGLNRLLLMLTVNALANAIPATLFLFFVSDYFQADRTVAPALLLSYFISALLGIFLWQNPLRRYGAHHIMTAAMLMGCFSFVWVLLLPSDGLIGFAVVCVLTGLALGAELICPAVLIGQHLQAAQPDNGSTQAGRVFGRWQLLAKCSLAAAAGLCLPGLALLGYQPGDSQALGGLLWTYAGLPCLLKLLAIGLQVTGQTNPQNPAQERPTP
jgi:GPH family glycoside/pentoside/hexuronide:cation symporter